MKSAKAKGRNWKLYVFLGILLVFSLASATYADSNQDLIEAIQNRNVSEVKSLLVQGADANTKDRDGNTALMYAVDEGYPEIVKTLIDYSADVNAKDGKYGWTALKLAIYHGYTEIAKILIAHGADTSELETQLAIDGDNKAFMMLEQAKADAHTYNVNRDLVHSAKNGDVARVKTMLAQGKNVNTKDNDGDTPLMWAALEGHLKVVKILLAHGADVNAIDKYGDTALYYAKFYGDPKIIRILKQAGARE